MRQRAHYRGAVPKAVVIRPLRYTSTALDVPQSQPMEHADHLLAAFVPTNHMYVIYSRTATHEGSAPILLIKKHTDFVVTR